MAGRQPRGTDEAWRWLGEAREVHLCGVADGRPVLRTMHVVAHDGALWLHGAPNTAMAGLAGGPVVLGAERVIARIPSWMRHPERACPATTWYRSVQAEGRLDPVSEPREKAAMLQAMMERHQPEGGHLPVDAAHPLYAAAVRGLGVWVVRDPSLVALQKLGQDQTADHLRGILRALWRRGDPGDLAAIELATEAHPEHPTFAEVPAGLRPRCHPTEADVTAAVGLVAEEYWNVGFPRERLAAAHRACSWVGLQGPAGLVATARILSDRGKRAWIYDVAVRPDARGAGVGEALIGLALDHPDLRGVAEVWLATRDADGFYARHGFTTVRVDEGPPWRRATMVRRTPAP